MKHDSISRSEFLNCENPFFLFQNWLKCAEKSEINDPNAMALATTDSENRPNIRMVLLKHADEEGFTFYTNFESEKGQELLANPNAALCFHWKSLRRQIRIRGSVEEVHQEAADNYFASRPKGSQIGAWASKQSRPLEERFALEKAVMHFTKRYGLKKVPRPSYWSGFCLKPLSIEFWQDRPFRLHDRMVFNRKSLEQPFEKQFLYP